MYYRPKIEKDDIPALITSLAVALDSGKLTEDEHYVASSWYDVLIEAKIRLDGRQQILDIKAEKLKQIRIRETLAVTNLQRIRPPSDSTSESDEPTSDA